MSHNKVIMSPTCWCVRRHGQTFHPNKSTTNIHPKKEADPIRKGFYTDQHFFQCKTKAHIYYHGLRVSPKKKCDERTCISSQIIGDLLLPFIVRNRKNRRRFYIKSLKDISCHLILENNIVENITVSQWALSSVSSFSKNKIKSKESKKIKGENEMLGVWNGTVIKYRAGIYIIFFISC